MKAEKNGVKFVYPNGSRKALTLRFDDAPIADKKMLELLNRHSLKATFYISMGMLKDDKHVSPLEIEKLYRSHEVANHTYSHLDPRKHTLSYDKLCEELLRGKLELEKMTDQKVSGYAYVCSSYGAVGRDEYCRALEQTGHKYAIMGRENNCFEPDIENRFDIGQSFRFASENLVDKAREFCALKPENDLCLILAMAHTYEFDMDRFPYGWDRAESFCNVVAERDDIWYTTNGELVGYLLALKNFLNSDSTQNTTYRSLFYESTNGIKELKAGECV